MSNRSAVTLRHGFTLIELALIVFIIVLLIVAIIPGLQAAKKHARRKDCVNNLKQIGLAYRTWNTGSSDEYPQAVEVQSGGSKEWLQAGQVSLHFRTMSNELTTPKILVCPEDPQKSVALSFAQGFTSANVSYFASLDAEEKYPQTFLSGDRNLVLNGRPVGPGTLITATNPPTALSWSKSIHDSCGNVGLADGSVQMLDQKTLAAAITNQYLGTNRLVLP